MKRTCVFKLMTGSQSLDVQLYFPENYPVKVCPNLTILSYIDPDTETRVRKVALSLHLFISLLSLPLCVLLSLYTPLSHSLICSLSVSFYLSLYISISLYVSYDYIYIYLYYVHVERIGEQCPLPIPFPHLCSACNHFLFVPLICHVCHIIQSTLKPEDM